MARRKLKRPTRRRAAKRDKSSRRRAPAKKKRKRKVVKCRRVKTKRRNLTKKQKSWRELHRFRQSRVRRILRSRNKTVFEVAPHRHHGKYRCACGAMASYYVERSQGRELLCGKHLPKKHKKFIFDERNRVWINKPRSKSLLHSLTRRR